MKVINRIKKNDDFGLTINKGKANRLPSFLIFCLKTNTGFTRVGISVSKKLGNAVVRNRTKRQVRAMCDSIIDYSQRSLDIVIIVKNNFLNMTFDENKSQISDLMKGL